MFQIYTKDDEEYLEELEQEESGQNPLEFLGLRR
jgi:hypothetical protein